MSVSSSNRMWIYSACAVAGACAACVMLGAGFLMGRWSEGESPARGWDGLRGLASHQIPVELLQATATHGTSTMAVCTARIDEESDGFFALDYLTGELKGWVFNPRMGAFGGLFATNVSQFLGPPGKNAEYLLVSGHVQPPASGTTTRSASMILYVVDVRGGQFAAFSVPWDKSMKNAGATQANVLVPVGGDVIRAPLGPGAGARKPPAGNAKADANNPNAPANNANPPNNNNQNNNQNKNNN